MSVVGLLFLLLLHRQLEDQQVPAAESAQVQRWTMICFACHLTFGLMVTYSPKVLHYLGGDATIYHNYAKWIVEFGPKSIVGLEHGKEGYYYTIVALYKVFGPYMTAGLALNATVSAAVIPLMTDATRRLFGWEAARRVAPIFFFLPAVFLFTSQMLKEAVILFLLAVAANASVRTLERVSLSLVLAIAGPLAILFTYRAPVALVVGAGFVLGVTLGKPQVVSGFTTGLSTLVFLGILVTTVGVGYSGFRSVIERSTLEETNRQRSGLGFQTDSGFGSEIDTGTARGALNYLPTAMANFALGPFPWRLRGLRQIPALFDVAALWVLLPSLWRGLRTSFRKHGRRVAVLLVPGLAVACMLSLSVGNYGILVRERIQVLLLLLPFFAYGLSLRNEARAPAESGEAVPLSTAPFNGRPATQGIGASVP